MAPDPSEVGTGQIELRNQVKRIENDIDQILYAATTVVEDNLQKLGLTGKPKVSCETILVDQARYVHPVITVLNEDLTPAVSYATGGRDLKELYVVTISPELIEVDWDMNKSDGNRFSTRSPAVHYRRVNGVELDGDKLTARTPEGTELQNFLYQDK